MYCYSHEKNIQKLLTNNYLRAIMRKRKRNTKDNSYIIGRKGSLKMVLYTSEQTFNINLNLKVWSGIEEDRLLSVFLLQRKFDKVHKIFSEKHLPKDRITWLEFGWKFEDLILHVSGEYDNGISYSEEITVELNQKEKDCIEKVVQPIVTYKGEFSQIKLEKI